jgi:hypothetical protein
VQLIARLGGLAPSPRKSMPFGTRVLLACATFVLLVVLFGTSPSGAVADVPAGSFVFGGWVRTMAKGEDGSTYVAGAFKEELEPTGSGLVVPASGEGLPDELTYPQVIGDIWAVVADGAGGWYIGGDFRYVGGQQRRGLAHILSSGALDPGFHPEVSFSEPRFNGGSEGARALALSGSTLYVGGNFGSIGGQTRHGLAGIDTATGTVTSWNPEPKLGGVQALATEGSTLYVGGGFSEIAGQQRHGLAAFQVGNGALTSWNPGPQWTSGFGVRGVTSIAPGGATVYVGGGFSEIGGATRSNLAAVDATTGLATSWNPGPEFGVLSLAISGSTLYVGGEVEGTGHTIGGQEREGLAAVSLVTGEATSWQPEPHAYYGYPEVSSIAVAGSTVYVVGNFSEIGGAKRSDAAALTTSTASATAWNPNIPPGFETRGSVNWRTVSAVAAAGSHVYIGGSFAGAGRPLAKIGGLARLEPDGALDTSWKGEAAGVVTDLAPVGNTLYVSGSLLAELGGQQRLSVGAVNAHTGEATSWHASNGMFEALGTVNAIAATGSTVYVGSSGAFEVEGDDHYGITALSAATGAALPFPELEGGSWPTAYSLAVSDGTLYVGGNFSGLGGEARNALGAIDLSDDAVTDWAPDVSSFGNTTVSSVVPDGSSVYVSGSFNEAEGQDRSCVAAFDAASGSLEPFDPGFIGGGSCPMQIAPSGSTVYLGGNFNSFFKYPDPSVERINLAALDSSTGAVTGWESPVPEASVNALEISGSRLLVGGAFQFIGDRATGPFTELSTGPQRTLSVSKAGSGSGTVTSTPSAINCGSGCSASFTDGAVVTLTATAGAGSSFMGWSGGGCSGTGTCHLVLGADTSVTATFDSAGSGSGGGGSTGGGSAPGGSPAPPSVPPRPSSKPKPKKIKCKKGYKKIKKAGKTRCVKLKKHG